MRPTRRWPALPRKFSVLIRADGVIEVTDNGRGIPVEIHPEEGRPAVELVFCKLHAGGKFNKKESGNAYRFSGGLHGVGVSVTNALSTRLEVEIRRGGGIHHIAFGAGFVTEPLIAHRRLRPAQHRHHGAHFARSEVFRFAENQSRANWNICCARKRC